MSEHEWGSAAVGLLSPKSGENVGGAMRAAHCYRATMVAIQTERSRRWRQS